MGIFNSFFGGETPQDSNVAWRQLHTAEQLDNIISESADKPVIIFKHSTRCSISRMALKQFESEFALQDKVTPYFLDLLMHRDISNEIAKRFDVTHQSPQLLLIRNGIAIYNTSHSDIDASKLKTKVSG